MAGREPVTNTFQLEWNDYVSVANFTLMSYEYLLLLEKEVQYVWKRQFSLMTGLYLVVRYLGLSLAIIGAFWGGMLYMPEAPCHGIIVFLYWGFSVYFFFAEIILIWRLHALYDQSKRVLYFLLGLFFPIVALEIVINIYLYSRTAAFSVSEEISPLADYCTFAFKSGLMFAIYTSIPIICYDVLLVVLAVGLLIKHLKERRHMRMRPNAYVIMIVQYHIIYFVLNLTNQMLMTVLWINIPVSVQQLSALFNDTIPFVIAPRLIISIWDTHANDGCVYNSNAILADCTCLTLSPPNYVSEEQVEMSEYM